MMSVVHNSVMSHAVIAQVDASTFFKRISPLHYSSVIRKVHVSHVARDILNFSQDVDQ